MTSTGDKLKRYLYCFPTLTNRCTVNWMTGWPEDALHSVAKKFIASMKLLRCRNDESNDAEVQSPQQTNDNDEELDGSQIELNEFQLKLARMSIYLYDSTINASKRYVLKLIFDLMPTEFPELKLKFISKLFVGARSQLLCDAILIRRDVATIQASICRKI